MGKANNYASVKKKRTFENIKRKQVQNISCFATSLRMGGC
jgi:hypothetical protein